MSVSEEQLRYWNLMFEVKFHLNYLDQCLEKSRKWERRLGFLTAIASSASIAAWVIWEKIGFVWASFVAASQVVNAIRPWLPFSKQIELFSHIIPEIQYLFNDMEKAYYDVANGHLTSREIHELTIGFRNRKSNLTKSLIEETIPQDGKLFLKAQSESMDYFKLNYQVEV